MGQRSGWLRDPVLHVLVIVVLLAFLGAWRASSQARVIETVYEPEQSWPRPERATTPGLPRPFADKVPG